MCRTLTTLGALGPSRRVSRCTCGAYHVVWAHLHLSLHPDEFAELCRLFASPLSAGERRDVGLWHLHLQEGAAGLWYGPMCVSLPADDVRELRALLLGVQVQPVAPRPLYALN
ncbi:hypothetical protein [uncultured Deinococcus sp.]|uniref:hypothetical protein n=1 Tax=uncultured Deinococcus sp. TaxID=158789 RepID=UPI00258BEFC5|nr:hypothetical protein [uncultured Deinococcus sp.]